MLFILHQIIYFVREKFKLFLKWCKMRLFEGFSNTVMMPFPKFQVRRLLFKQKRLHLVTFKGVPF